MRCTFPVVVTLVLSIACARGEDAGTSDTSAQSGDTGAGNAQPLTAQLSAQGGSGLNGNVTIQPQGSSAAFAIHVMGTAGTYTAHVHRGSCSAAGDSAVVADLGTVTVPQGGMVDHNATASVSLDSLANGQHVVGLHRESGGPHVACAELRR